MNYHPIWLYFSKIDGKDKVATCKKCNRDFSYRTSITNLRTHLKGKHIDVYDRYMEKSGSSRSRSLEREKLESPIEQQSSSRQEFEFHIEEYQQDVPIIKTEKLENILDQIQHNKPSQNEEKKDIDSMLLKFIAMTYQPFSIVEETDFVEFVRALNPNYVLPGRKVISELLIPLLYKNCLAEQKNIVQEQAKTICLTTDCWTSQKADAFIAITAHFINDNFERKSILLKCSEIKGENTSQNLALIIRQTCIEWDIFEKINFCVTDNAANIVGAINILGWTQCGCMAHKLNLAMQHSLSLFEEILKKVKDIVAYYRSCYMAKEKLLENQINVQGINQPIELINSVPTRWNSTYLMLQRFIHLKDAIIATTSHLDIVLPTITEEDWTTLKQLCKILKPFNEATSEISAEKYVCASKAVAIICGLKHVLAEIKQKPNYTDAIKIFVTNIETQLENRFQGLEYENNLAICTILDPRYKMSMFCDEGAAEAAKSSLVTKIVEMLITEEKSSSLLPELLENFESSDEDSVDNISIWRKRNLILKKRKVNPNPNVLQAAQKEIDAYLQDDYIQNDSNPCEWWQSNGQYKYPHLCSIFKTNHNIVATSVPSERLFSKAAHTLLDRRTRFSVKKTEQLVFLNANMRTCDFNRLMP